MSMGVVARLHQDELKVQLAAKDANHADWRAMAVWEFYAAVARMGGYVVRAQPAPARAAPRPGRPLARLHPTGRHGRGRSPHGEGARLMGENGVQT